jgi:hypothetical protein
MARRFALILSLLLVTVAAGACRQAPDFDDRLSVIVRPYRFSILRWQLDQLFGRSGSEPAAEALHVGDGTDSELVLEYFSLISRMRALQREINAITLGSQSGDLDALTAELERLQSAASSLRQPVQRVMGGQIREALSAQGIHNPLDRHIRLRFGFPPLNFRLDQPPNLLVISPRDRIESIREVMLVQDLNVDQFERIEAQVDALGVSSMVTELGGFGGTYPTFVAADATLPWTLSTATEEWLHQYLAFTPLGFTYLLDSIGVARDYEVATMNETLAGMVSDEVAAIVLDEFYPQYGYPQRPGTGGEATFDFNRTMRELRLAVDELLASGEIERAEQLMEERRQFLVSKGYYIRKLNQAYFAFYGTYADEPTSVSPIGAEMRELRRRSTSLREFLNTAAGMTGRKDLVDALEAPQEQDLLARTVGDSQRGLFPVLEPTASG